MGWFDADQENPLSVIVLEYRLWDEKPDAPTKLPYYKHTMSQNVSYSTWQYINTVADHRVGQTNV